MMMASDEVVRDQHKRDVEILGDAADVTLQIVAGEGVERRKRFVEEQDFRVGRKRARQRNALLLAAGEILNVAVGIIGQFDQFEHFGNAFRDLGPAAGEFEAERDILGDRHPGIE
jgi:hypothetical protein